MEKRVSAAKVMRVVSILGVICLLALQWVWWRNAYVAMEVDMMSRAEDCLIRAADKAIMYQMDSTSSGIKVVNEVAGERIPMTKVLSHSRTIQSAFDIEYTMEECINVLKRPVTDTLIDSRFCTLLKAEFGYVPKHTLRICRDSIRISPEEKIKFNRVAFGENQDSIFHQFGHAAYVMAVFPSPIGHYLKKGALILLFSIVLVLLIGFILVFQFLNMQRERKFSDFIIDYTRMITHDLRTPVTSLQMIFSMLLKGQVPWESKEKYAIEGLNLSKKVLLNLDNILYMAKSEQRELPVYKTEVNVRDFMEKTLKLYRERDYNPKSVLIETIYEPEDYNCFMDETLMESVVCNLMDNAIKFTGMDAKITVTCKREDDVVEWRFRDNGMGMSDEDRSRIFELFERGNSNKQFSGFGIGLHFVQRVVKAHSGKISVQSTVGEGSEFVVRFFS